MSPFCGLAFAFSCFVLFRVADGAEPCAAGCAARLGCSAGRNPKQRRWLQLCQHSRRRTEDFLPRKLSSAIFNLDPSILPLTDHHLALRRCVLPTLRLHLKQPIVVSHHPIVADDPFALQPEHLPQLCRVRCPSVIIFRLRCRPPEPPVVLWQIFLLQIHIRLLVRPNLLPPHLLDQPILMRAMVALHSPFRLRRSRRDDLDPQLPAHPPELRDGLLAQPQFHLTGRIVGHVHHASARTALLQPVVKTSIHLHQLPKVPPSFSPLPIRFPLPPPTPQPFG